MLSAPHACNQEEGLCKRAKRKACFNVLQQVQPRLAESNCHKVTEEIKTSIRRGEAACSPVIALLSFCRADTSVSP